MKIIKLKLSDPRYPDNFRELYKPPQELFVLTSNIEILQSSVPKIAIVGSRRPTIYGQAWTIKISEQLAKSDIIIVSGLALGIDSFALKTAVEANKPAIAILPCPLNKIYPAYNYGLAKQIVERGGALITQYPIGQTIHKHHFLERNRLIASLSDATLITEAARKSGSLHTAAYALDLGKELMTIPHSLDNANGIGNNNLLKNGAHLITSGEDIFEVMNWSVKISSHRPIVENEIQRAIVEQLENGALSSDEMCANLAYSASEINQNLIILELHGTIRCLGMGVYSK